MGARDVTEGHGDVTELEEDVTEWGVGEQRDVTGWKGTLLSWRRT